MFALLTACLSIDCKELIHKKGNDDLPKSNLPDQAQQSAVGRITVRGKNSQFFVYFEKKMIMKELVAMTFFNFRNKAAVFLCMI